MSSNLELLEQRIANLEAEKDELKGENAELKNENAKLKRIIEENARRDAENAEHKRIADNVNIESIDTFLDETFKKSVSDGFRQRNREKKLLHESATQDLSATSAPEKNHMTEISMTVHHEKSDMDNPPNILQNLACLIQGAWNAKDEAILANQKELLCWCSYIVEFNKKTTEFMTEYKIGEKKVKGMIYDNLIKLLRPSTKHNTLLKQTQRARDIYKLFEKIGIDKIKYITTYSVNSISELSDSQIQTIVDYFSKNPNTELPDDRDGTIIDFKEDILNDQDNVLGEQAKPLVSATRAEVKVMPPIPQPETLIHDRSYFRNKTLDQYPNLDRKFSSEDFDYYGINDETLCPLCKLDHDDEEGIDETGYELWQLSEDRLLINSKPENKVSFSFSSEQCEEKGPITFEVRPDPELIIKSVLEHFPYLKFGNSFRGIDNYDFTSPQPWSSPCPICDGKHGNYGLHGSWYCKNGNQLPYDPELAKLLSQDKLEYCLTCNTSSNKLKFAIVA
ncbi:hypothetical protein C1646_776612 [Rhizophagus diaphanus]|nr:hypothetical protein C1646_776612 [Rhizophagus diaphanus] [Rhizophagus sp. MUCL 43196]